MLLSKVDRDYHHIMHHGLQVKEGSPIVLFQVDYELAVLWVIVCSFFECSYECGISTVYKERYDIGSQR